MWIKGYKMTKPLDILLIDDSVKTQDMFGFALNDLQINYSCRFARNVEQAVNSLRLQPADYIFVDVNMPARISPLMASW